MSESILKAEVRNQHGKSGARKLRREGLVPGVFYGESVDPVSIEMNGHDLAMKIREGHSVYSLEFEGKDHQAIIRELQYHPVKGDITHIDFLAVKKGQKITMSIPVRFEGKPVGVKAGGNLQEIKGEIEITVLPKDIPDEIVANIDHLDIGDALRVEDIKIDYAEVNDDPSDVLCRVALPKVVEEVVPEEVEEEEEAAEPEVITAREKEEESE